MDLRLALISLFLAGCDQTPDVHWVCDKSHRYLQPMPMGKGMLLMPMTHCDEGHYESNTDSASREQEQTCQK